MANKDFRQRLRDAEVDYNPQAWDQMNDMLNQLPKDEDKKRPFFFWLFALLSLALLLFSAVYFFQTSQKAQEQISSQKILSETNTDKEEELQAEKVLSHAQQDKSDIVLEIGESETKKEETQAEQNYANINSNDLGNYNRDLSLNQPTVSLSQKPGNLNTQVDSQNGMLRNTDSVQEVFSQLPLSSQQENEQLANNTKGAGNNNQISNPMNKDNKLSVTNRREQELVNSAANIRSLQLIPVEDIFRSDVASVMPALIDVINPIDRAYRYVFGKAGFARFNSNNGYHLGLGVVYELDQILAFQPEIAYSNGRDRSKLANDRFEFERQLDVSLLALISLFQSYEDKVRLEIGIGYTNYSGLRIINASNPLDERASTGRNYTVGMSYSRRLNSGDAVGLKLGTVIYDDAVTYLSLNYYKRF